jgi:hypothetical protein
MVEECLVVEDLFVKVAITSAPTAEFKPIETAAIGVHPDLPVPQGACGSFSFNGRRNSLFFIWTQFGHQLPTAAWIRSLVPGFALITFHPCAMQPNGQIVVFLNLAVPVVPPINEFRIEFINQGGLNNLLLPAFNNHYNLQMGKCRFYVGGF